MGIRRHGQEPAHALPIIQKLVRAQRYRITESALQGAADIYWDEDDVVESVLALTDGDFEQSYESEKRPGTFQDVYKPRHHGYRLFVKLQLVGDVTAAIISFKRDTSG